MSLICSSGVFFSWWTQCFSEPLHNKFITLHPVRCIPYEEVYTDRTGFAETVKVIYDAEQQRYYMFFSATPDVSGEEVGEGVLSGDGYQLMMVATSEYPDRGFQLVNFKDANSCGEENLHTYNDKRGVKDLRYCAPSNC